MSQASYRRQGTIPNGPFREAFLRSGLTPNDVAERCGWVRTHMKNGKPVRNADSQRVKLLLGLRTYKCSRTGKRRTRKGMNLDTALALAEALDLDPVDLDF